MVWLDFSIKELADCLAEDVVIGVEESSWPDVGELRHLGRRRTELGRHTAGMSRQLGRWWWFGLTGAPASWSYGAHNYNSIIEDKNGYTEEQKYSEELTVKAVVIYHGQRMVTGRNNQISVRETNIRKQKEKTEKSKKSHTSGVTMILSTLWRT